MRKMQITCKRVRDKKQVEICNDEVQAPSIVKKTRTAALVAPSTSARCQESGDVKRPRDAKQVQKACARSARVVRNSLCDLSNANLEQDAVCKPPSDNAILQSGASPRKNTNAPQSLETTTTNQTQAARPKVSPRPVTTPTRAVSTPAPKKKAQRPTVSTADPPNSGAPAAERTSETTLDVTAPAKSLIIIRPSAEAPCSEGDAEAKATVLIVPGSVENVSEGAAPVSTDDAGIAPFSSAPSVGSLVKAKTAPKAKTAKLVKLKSVLQAKAKVPRVSLPAPTVATTCATTIPAVASTVLPANKRKVQPKLKAWAPSVSSGLSLQIRGSRTCIDGQSSATAALEHPDVALAIELLEGQQQSISPDLAQTVGTAAAMARGGAETAREYQEDRGLATQVASEMPARRASDPSSGRPPARYPGRMISRTGSSSDRSVDRRRREKSNHDMARPKSTERSRSGQDTSAQEDDKTKQNPPHKMRGWYSVQQARHNIVKQKKKDMEEELAAKERYEMLKKNNKRPPATHVYAGWYSNKQARCNVIEAKKRKEEEIQIAQRKKMTINEELKKLALMTRAYKTPMSTMKTDRPDPQDTQSPMSPFKPPARSAVPGKRTAVNKFRCGVRSSPLNSMRRRSQKRKPTPRQRQTHQPGQRKRSHQESQTTESKIEKPLYNRSTSNRSRSMQPCCRRSDISACVTDPVPPYHLSTTAVSCDHIPFDLGPYQDMLAERSHRRALSLDVGLGRKCLAHRQKQCTRNLVDGIRHRSSAEHIIPDTNHGWNEPVSFGASFYHDSDHQIQGPYLTAHRRQDAEPLHPPFYEQPPTHHIPFPANEHQRPAVGGGHILGGISSIAPPAGSFQLSGSDYDSQVHEPQRTEIVSVHAAAITIQKNVRRWISNRHLSQHWIEMQQRYLAARQHFQWPTETQDAQHYHIPFPEESPNEHLHGQVPRRPESRREPQPTDVGLPRMGNWDNQRPPSRGGESWQPLGQTSPPAYEQVTPEQFEQFQLICSPREASRQDSRGPPNEYNISVVDAVRLRENFPSPPSTPTLPAELQADDGNAFVGETSHDVVSEQAEENALWTPASQTESGDVNSFNDIEQRARKRALLQTGDEESRSPCEDEDDADVDINPDVNIAGGGSDAPSHRSESEQAKESPSEKTMSEAENEEPGVQEEKDELYLSLKESVGSAATPPDMVAAVGTPEKMPVMEIFATTSARSALESPATSRGKEDGPACSREHDQAVRFPHHFNDGELPKSAAVLDMEFAESLHVLEAAEQGLAMATDLQNLNLIQQSQHQQMLINQAQQEEAKRDLLLQNDLQMRAAMDEVEAQQRIVADSLVQGVYAAQTDMQLAHQSILQKLGEQELVNAQLQREERVKLERQEKEYKEREEMLAKREAEMLKREREHQLREREAIEQAVIRREEQHRRREMLKTPAGWANNDNRALSVKGRRSADKEEEWTPPQARRHRDDSALPDSPPDASVASLREVVHDLSESCDATLAGKAVQTAVSPNLTRYDARSNSDISIVSSSVLAEKMDVQLQQALGPGTHKTVRRLIPSLPSHRQDSAPSSARSPISSSDEKSNPSILAGDQFARFSNDLARRLAQDESRRGQMEEQLFAIQQRSVDENLTAQLRDLQEQVRASGSSKTEKWMKRRVRKVTMRAEEQHKALEMKRQEAEMLSQSRRIMLQDLSSIISLKGTKLGCVKKKETPKELISPRVPDMDEATIDMRLHSLTQDMETCGLHEVQNKKEEALRLYRRKKQLISEKLHTEKLQREKDATKLLLDKALSLRIDDEVTKRQAADSVVSEHAKEPSVEDSAQGTSLELDDSVQFDKPPLSENTGPELSARQAGEPAIPCSPQRLNATGALAVDDDAQDSIAEIDESFYESTGAEDSSFVMLLERPVAAPTAVPTADRSIDEVAESSEIYNSHFEVAVEESTWEISQRAERRCAEEVQGVIAQDPEVSLISVPPSDSIQEDIMEASGNSLGNQDSRSASSRAKVVSAAEDSHTIPEMRESMFDSTEFQKSHRSFANDKLPGLDYGVAVESHELDPKASIDDIANSVDDECAETRLIDEPTRNYSTTTKVKSPSSNATTSPYARMIGSFRGLESSSPVCARPDKEDSIDEQQSSLPSPRSGPKVASLRPDSVALQPALAVIGVEEKDDDDDEDVYSMSYDDASLDNEIPEDLEIGEELPLKPCGLNDLKLVETDDASIWSGEKDPQDDDHIDLRDVDKWIGIEGGFSFFRNRSETVEEICLADEDDEVLVPKPVEEICLAEDDDEKLAKTSLSTPPSLQQPQSVPAASGLLDLESILGEKDDEDKTKKPLSTIPRPPSPPPCTPGMSPVETEEMTDLVVEHVLDSLLAELWDDLEKIPLTSRALAQEPEMAEEVLDCSLESADLFLDHVMELLNIETEDTSLSVTKHSLDAGRTLNFFVLKQQTTPEPSWQQRQDLESWLTLLIDVYNDMLKNIPKMYTEKKTWTRWRTGFGVSPLQKYHESTCPVVTMRLVREKVIDHMATGNPRPEDFTANGVPFMNEEMLDVLLDKEIREEEKTWLDVQKDATWMKNQIAARIWDELVEQVAVDLLDMAED